MKIISKLISIFLLIFVVYIALLSIEGSILLILISIMLVLTKSKTFKGRVNKDYLRIHTLVIFIYGLYLGLLITLFIYMFFVFLDRNNKKYIIFPVMMLIITITLDCKLKTCHINLEKKVSSFYKTHKILPFTDDLNDVESCDLFLNKKYNFYSAEIQYYRLTDDRYVIRPVGSFYHFLYFPEEP